MWKPLRKLRTIDFKMSGRSFQVFVKQRLTSYFRQLQKPDRSQEAALSSPPVSRKGQSLLIWCIGFTMWHIAWGFVNLCFLFFLHVTERLYMAFIFRDITGSSLSRRVWTHEDIALSDLHLIYHQPRYWPIIYDFHLIFSLQKANGEEQQKLKFDKFSRSYSVLGTL